MTTDDRLKALEDKIAENKVGIAYYELKRRIKALEARVEELQSYIRSVDAKLSIWTASKPTVTEAKEKPECDGSFCKFCGPMNCICDGYGNEIKPVPSDKISIDRKVAEEWLRWCDHQPCDVELQQSIRKAIKESDRG